MREREREASSFSLKVKSQTGVLSFTLQQHSNHAYKIQKDTQTTHL